MPHSADNAGDNETNVSQREVKSFPYFDWTFKLFQISSFASTVKLSLSKSPK